MKQTATTKDTRVMFFRKTLEGLLESLDATIRVDQWSGPEEVPGTLKERAAEVVVRLGSADRLASGSFTGTSADAARVAAMLAAMRRLDQAYVVYRRRRDRAPSDREAAATALDATIDEVRSDAPWGC